MKLASETEIKLYEKRIDLLMDTVFKDEDGSDCDIRYLVSQAYIRGFKDADLGRE